jgi:hypothetical protein
MTAHTVAAELKTLNKTLETIGVSLARIGTAQESEG